VQYQRDWCDPPIVSEQLSNLPGAAGASSSFGDPEHGLCEVTGRFSCVDVWVSVPADWWAANALLRLTASVGSITTTLDHRRIRDLQGPPQQTPPVPPDVDPSRTNGVLFSIRGKPCDRFGLSAFSAAVDLSQANFAMRAWGGDIGIYGDRNTRLPVDLFARPNQQIIYSRGVGTFPADGDVMIPVNPSGGRCVVTSCDWTTAQVLFNLQIVDDVFGLPQVPLLTFMSGIAAAAGIAGGPYNFTYPYFTRLGAQVLLVAPGIVGASNALNLAGFHD